MSSPSRNDQKSRHEARRKSGDQSNQHRKARTEAEEVSAVLTGIGYYSYLIRHRLQYVMVRHQRVM